MRRATCWLRLPVLMSPQDESRRVLPSRFWSCGGRGPFLANNQSLNPDLHIHACPPHDPSRGQVRRFFQRCTHGLPDP